MKDVFSSKFPTWVLSLNFSYPIGTSIADASLAREGLEGPERHQPARPRAERHLAGARRRASAEANGKRVDATKAARVLAERRLEAEEKKFAAGMSTSFEVFQAQRDLAQARTTSCAPSSTTTSRRSTTRPSRLLRPTARRRLPARSRPRSAARRPARSPAAPAARRRAEAHVTVAGRRCGLNRATDPQSASLQPTAHNPAATLLQCPRAAGLGRHHYAQRSVPARRTRSIRSPGPTSASSSTRAAPTTR